MEVKKGRKEGDGGEEGKEGRDGGEEGKENEGEKRATQALEAQTHLAPMLVVSHLQRQDLSHASVCETLICKQ